MDRRGEALAQGISLALVATAFGLVIAIFAVAAYYYLLNRVDILVRDLDEKTRQVIELVSSEAVRPAGPDRRHGAISTLGPAPAGNPGLLSGRRPLLRRPSELWPAFRSLAQHGER